MKPSELKQFYSVPDWKSVRHTPQPIQHIVINDYAKKVGGGIVFYLMEDSLSSDHHWTLRERLEISREDLTGIVFYTLSQIGGSKPFAFLEELVGRGYEVHFAKDRISILSAADLPRVKMQILTLRHLEARGPAFRYFEPLLPR